MITTWYGCFLLMVLYSTLFSAFVSFFFTSHSLLLSHRPTHRLNSKVPLARQLLLWHITFFILIILLQNGSKKGAEAQGIFASPSLGLTLCWSGSWWIEMTGRVNLFQIASRACSWFSWLHSGGAFTVRDLGWRQWWIFFSFPEICACRLWCPGELIGTSRLLWNHLALFCDLWHSIYSWFWCR